MDFSLQNAATANSATQYVRFNQIFAEGDLPQGQSLSALVGTQTVPLQIDVLTRYADGSVKSAILTMAAPTIAAGATIDGTLVVGGAAGGAAIAANAALAQGYDLAVNMNIAGFGATTVNAAQQLANAVASGDFEVLRQGPLATEIRFDVAITRALRLTFDVVTYADGSVSTKVHFQNDAAMGATGGAIQFNSVSIVEGGVTSFSKANFTQYQYQVWAQDVTQDGSARSTLNVRHDMDYLQQTGAIWSYDLTASVGAAPSVPSSWTNVLGVNGIEQAMGTAGHRPDIGPTTEANARWLITQDASAATYALAQAQAAGSIPWHYYDTAKGHYLSVEDHPTLWIDSRAAVKPRQIAGTESGWDPDRAHTPDLSYVAWLMTGDRYHLDMLNAQASWVIANTWNDARQNGQGLVANSGEEMRQQAWALRTVQQAAYANPDGSYEKAYFTDIANNNWAYLRAQTETLTAKQGELYGYFEGQYTTGLLPPWQQNYYVSTTTLGALQGNEDARAILKWQANFHSGVFLSPDINPYNGFNYVLKVYNANDVAYTTWAQVAAATQAAGFYETGPSADNAGAFAGLAAMSNANIITVFSGGEDPTDHRVAADAMRAYGWILGAGMPDLRLEPQFQVAPRMADGSQIGVTEMHVVAPTAQNTTVTFAGANAFIYDRGVGRTTLIGTTGADVLIDNSTGGGDRLDGRAGDDYLIGGTGANVFAPGAGQDYALIRGGAARIEVNAQSAGRIEIEGFRPGTDTIVLTGSLSLPAVLASARADGYGGTLLTISSERTIRLNGLAPSSVTNGMFDVSGANQGGSGTNNAPVAVADTNGSDTVREGGTGDVTGDPSATGNVLTNDTDVDAGDTKTVTTTGSFTGTYGTLSLAANGTWTYTLNNADPDTQALTQGQSVADVFNYTMRDTSGATSSSTLSINITGTNDSTTTNNAPVAVADTNGSDTVREGGTGDVTGDPSATGNVLTNDTDVDAGDTKTVTTTGSFTGTYGTLSLAANGTWTYTLNNADPDTQALTQGQSVADVFNYTMRDTAGATSSSTLSITIAGANDGTGTSTTLNVGAGQTYSTLAAAVAASRDGDTIAVQAGTYVNDFATITTDITIIGVGGMANFVATVPPPNGKGILVTQSDVTIQNLSFSGAAVADQNGAGIRYESGNLVVIDSYFNNNQMGILANDNPSGTIRITGSEFTNTQGGGGTALRHNLYVNNIASLIIDDSYFHDAFSGHQIKSRAQSTTITNSRIYDDAGDGSYSIDLPNGGVAVIRNNVIQQGPNSDNPGIISYSAESAPYAGSSLLIESNVVVNDLATSGARLLYNNSSLTSTISNNSVYGLTAGQIALGSATVSGTTFLSTRPTLDTSAPWLGGGGGTPGTIQGTNGADTLVGTASAETLLGLDGADTLDGGDGGDRLVGGAGNDVIYGGAGSDVAVFSGNWSAYTITESGGTTTLVGPDGTDRVSGVEQFQFANGTFAASAIVNDAPNATNDTNGSDTVREGGTGDVTGDPSASGNVLTNDSDADTPLGDSLTVTGVSSVSEGTTGTLGSALIGKYGSLTLNANGTWSYSLNNADVDTQALATGTSGQDVFSYTVRDVRGATSTAQLTITVAGANDPGGAAPDTNAGDAVSEAGVNPGNTAFAGDATATGNVLTNDTGTSKTVTTTGSFTGTYGALSLAADGTWTYTLNNADADTQALRQGQSVTDVFTYTMSDGAGQTSSSTLTVTIAGTNDAPVAVASTNAGDAVTESGVNPGNTTFAGDASATGNVLTNDTDIDAGDTKTVTTTGSFTGTYGTLSLAANGTWTYTLNNADADTQALTQGQSVTDVFNYTMRDASGATSSSTLSVTITGTNDAPVAVADTNAGDAVSESGVNPGNTAFAGDATATGNVLTNDTDVDPGDTKTVTTIGSFTGTYGTLSLAANGTWTYTLNNADADTQALRQGQTVADVFNYTMRDTAGATSSSTLSITITGTNDVPVAVADNVSASQNIATTYAASTLLSNDTDVDSGATRTIASVASGTNGTVSLNGKGDVVFTPTAGFTGTATFTYTVSDGSATSAPVGVTVQVAGQPDTLSGGGGSDTLSGDAGSDTLRGMGGADKLFGGADNDRIEGGTGNDTLDGGTGADVMYGGTGTDVYIVDNVNDVVIEARALFAQDMVTGAVAGWSIDTGSLSAQTAMVRPGIGWLWAGNADFNGDGRADNLFRNLITGENLVWYLDGNGARSGSANLSIPTVDLSWSIAGVGDFNGDGRADVLWRNQGAGLTSLWTMNGVTATSTNLLSLQVGAPWQIAGVGDFNGDGKSDILWRNPTTGATSIWQMNGATATATTLLSASAPVGWTVGAVADFASDGRADIAWRTSSGSTELWQMNGATRTAVTTPTSFLPASDWRVVGLGTPNSALLEIDRVESSVSYTIGEGVEQLLLTGSSSINGTGNAANNVITGNDGANTLFGMAGHDSLFGGLGLDVLYGGAGNDTLDGGASVDTLYGGAGNDVYIVDNAGDVAFEGASTPVNMLYAQDMVTGAVAGWSIDTGSLGAQTAMVRPGIGWLWAGNADFNGDGRADNLFRNLLTGENLVWYLDASGARTGSANLSIATVDLSWSIAGVGDFNGDGRADVLWRNQDAGLTSLWTMNGVTATSTNLLSIQVGAPWQIDGVADFNGDGRADILWRDPTSGLTSIWQMNGATATSTTLLSANAPVGWTVGAVADFTGDGRADIAWRTSSGATELWQMNGATRTAVTTPTWALPGGDWNVVGKGQIIPATDNDRVESSVSYTIGDGIEQLLLTGSSPINGTGNAANNVIIGNSAANTLTGGAGADTLTGGGGADVFAYAAGDGSDVITDFNAGQGDKIDLTGVSFLSANGSVATLSSGHSITATNGYNWAAGDFI